jgi:polysaccharide biosynthesis/export protein
MRSFVPVVAAAILAMWSAAPALAQEYAIGPEDVLQVSVWMHPELERSVTVGRDGNITFPPIGEVKAAGQSTSQLGARLADRLSGYLRQTATVTVTVSQYVSQSVFVSGGVAKPGRYGFEKMPGLIDVLNEAGGAVAGADLSQVQIIRREGDLRKPQTVNVAAAMRAGTDTALPALKPGDTIVIPVSALGGTGTVAGGPDVAGVLGEVQHPGLYPMSGGLDLWMVLAQAGGLTARGNLGDVRVVRPRESGGASVFSVNLRDQLDHGAREPFVVRAGDVVVVRGPGGWSTTWSGVTQLLATSRDILNIIVIEDYLKNRNQNSTP